MEQTLRTKIVVALLFNFFGFFFLAQAQNIVQGSRIIQLAKNTTPFQWFQHENVQIELLSRNANIWEIQFASELKAEQWEWNELVLLVQKNHILTKRTVPNDPQYSNQWQHNATSANAPLLGVFNGDVGAEEAWDVTTGGQLPVSGDDIVVCVLDDGIVLNHPDLQTNLWVNENEIPNNGIDDDNNGYTDDYLGWNTQTNTDAIDDPSTADRDHGTPVAGMIGADGNNAEGLTGINWNVKLMIVMAWGDESDAIKGYDYPLTLRKRYNETNGADGAFVVATNASWGVDFGFPADAPIWCGLYDSLGQAGILNTAAVPNNNRNVDVLGDLPTTCPSKYLIGVTNSNVLGEKVNDAGYGTTSVDLSAPGEEVITTKLVGYGSESGTSFAAPMVAGAIALSYADICAEMEQGRLTHPDSVAYLVKEAILTEVKQQSTQSGLTVTEGSLWTPGALEGMEKMCWRYTSTNNAEEKSSNIRVFPNPGKSELTIQSEYALEFKVYDAIGQIITTGSANKEIYQLQTQSWEPGLYIIQLKSANGVETVKWLKN